jgi:hypothetical protein
MNGLKGLYLRKDIDIPCCVPHTLFHRFCYVVQYSCASLINQDWRYSSTIYDLDTRWVCSALPPGKTPLLSIVLAQEFGWASEPIWVLRKRKGPYYAALIMLLCTLDQFDDRGARAGVCSVVSTIMTCSEMEVVAHRRKDTANYVCRCL